MLLQVIILSLLRGTKDPHFQLATLASVAACLGCSSICSISAREGTTAFPPFYLYEAHLKQVQDGCSSFFSIMEIESSLQV